MIYIILSVILLIVFLGDYFMLRKSSGEMEKKLKRLERRIESLDQQEKSQLADDSHPETAEGASRFVADVKQVESRISEEADRKPGTTPPPLPPLSAAKKTKDTTEATAVTKSQYNDAVPSGEKPSLEKPHAPSLFERIPWRSILERMHCWPPSRSEAGENAEIQLAAWWTVRLGLIMLILASVFGGVYVSQKTPPEVRILALLAVSLGTIVLGAKMKDRLEGFGRPVTAGGFALLYFTAFAAFALPATKVIYSPGIGILCQFAALLAAITWSLWKNDRTIATLTVLLGYISCGFSHNNDLDRFTLVGLTLLAATGSFLFARRGWLAAFLTSLIGSWTAFAAFALLDWVHRELPPYSTILITAAVLAAILEAGNLIGITTGSQSLSKRWQRWLILSNTSAAALLGYGITRLLYAEELSTFYFTFALLYFAFTLVHFLRTSDQAVTETLFLKTSALLCLGFASHFEGPLRWLAIAFQSFALLWTARRSGSRWIALGFAVVFAVSLGWFWRDLLFETRKEWLWLDTFRIFGSLYLVFLTVQLSLHSKWFPHGIGGVSDKHREQARWALLTGSLALGISAIVFAWVPAGQSSSDSLWFLLLLSLIMGAVSPIMRRVLPCITISLPLLSIYLAYPFLQFPLLQFPDNQSSKSLLLGATLSALSFGIAELIRRFWMRNIKAAAATRGIILLLGLLVLLPFTYHLAQRLELSSDAAIAVFAILPVTASVALLSRHQAKSDEARSPASAGFYLAAGFLVFLGGLSSCQRSDYFSSVLVIASLPLFASLFRIQSPRAVLAGAVPLLAGILVLWIELLMAEGEQFNQDLVNLIVIIIVSIGLAAVLWNKVRSPHLLRMASYADAALHGLAIISLHLFFQKHLIESAAFFASTALGLAVLLISRRFPFRTLSFVSWLPVTLAFFSGLLNESWWGAANAPIWYWLANAIVLAHLLLAHHWMQQGDQPDSAFATDTLRYRFQPLQSLVSMAAWTLAAVAASNNPWHALALAGVALLCASLWRWKKIEWLEGAGLLPLLLAAFASFHILWWPDPDSDDHMQLLNVILVAIAITANGVILATARNSRTPLSSSVVLPWLLSGLALLLAYTCFATDRLVSDNLTTVFWGLSSILLFVCGLFTGIRTYRLMGLIGLAACIPRIFIWDIQDTFYRIIAFFAIALVLLAIAFLYNRFRDRITSFEQKNS